MTTFTCPTCFHPVGVTLGYAAGVVTCPHCQAQFSVPPAYPPLPKAGLPARKFRWGIPLVMVILTAAWLWLPGELAAGSLQYEMDAHTVYGQKLMAWPWFAGVEYRRLSGAMALGLGLFVYLPAMAVLSGVLIWRKVKGR